MQAGTRLGPYEVIALLGAPEGNVKLLDFGLAKAFTPGSEGSDLSESPTLEAGASLRGVILGTVPYMSGHLSAIPRPRDRPGEDPMDLPSRVDYLDAERMLPVLVRKAA